MVEITMSSILMSHAPRMHALHLGILATGVLWDIDAIWILPPDSYRFKPAVACLPRLNFRRLRGCSHASKYGSGDMYIMAMLPWSTSKSNKILWVGGWCDIQCDPLSTIVWAADTAMGHGVGSSAGLWRSSRGCKVQESGTFQITFTGDGAADGGHGTWIVSIAPGSWYSDSTESLVTKPSLE